MSRGAWPVRREKAREGRIAGYLTDEQRSWPGWIGASKCEVTFERALSVEGVGLYGGTKHTVATALGQVLTPEEIKRGGTGSRTNKAFDRYYQPHKREHVRVITAIKKLKNDVRGELVDLKTKKN